MTGKLLDTTVLIDLSRGNIDAANFIDTARASGIPLFVSVISAMELIVGCRDKGEVNKAEQLIADFGLVQITPAESAKAYFLILACSKSHGLPY
jgi:predicted nucleic acid-binding protein